MIGQCIAQLGIKGVEPRDLIDLIDGYQLGGVDCANKELKGLQWGFLFQHIVVNPSRAGGVGGQ